jgi:DNA-directed RNA polymerase subunit K/omega
VRTSKTLKISLEEQTIIEEKLRKFVKQQLEEGQENHILRETIRKRKDN